MALEAGCGAPTVRGVLCAGLALSLRADVARAAQSCAKPVAIVQAELDRFGSPSEVEKLLEGAAGPRRLGVVARAGHLFTEDLGALEREVSAAMEWLLVLPAVAPETAAGTGSS
jgi:fermentation-respiration switch protein FrsA (DUF1100 family)